MKKIFFIPLFFLLFAPLWILAQPKAQKEQPKTTRILFLLDGSGSMMAEWDGRKRIEIAREILADLSDSLTKLPRVEVAMRIYGHQFAAKSKNCTDSKLEVPFAVKNGDAIRKKLFSITPQGVTPIAYSLEQATKDFPDDKNARNIIIMVTDGIESCGADPCAISLGLQKKGIFLKPFIIGMGIEKNYADAFKCMGRFFNAQNTGEFRKALAEVTNQTLGKTTIFVELLDINNNPKETDVNIAFVNTVTQQPLYNIVHFRDAKGQTDELEIDAIPTYDLYVYTTPPVVKENIEIIGGKKNIIKVNSPQGEIVINQKGFTDYGKNFKAEIMQAGKCEILVSQQIGENHRYLVGSYDIIVPTIPPTYFKNVKVSQDKVSYLDVPGPGTLTIQNKMEGFGSIYSVNADGKQEWVCNVVDRGVAEINMPLQPGKYRFVFRAKNVTSSDYSKIIDFSIQTGASSVVNVLMMK